MKRRFGFSMKGGQIFPLFILFYVLFAASYGGFVWAAGKLQDSSAATSRHAAAFFLCLIVLLLVCTVFTILFSRKLIPAVSLDGVPFKFERPLPRFLGMNVWGLLLSAVTLGVYTPWYAAKVIRSYAAGISYKGMALEFRGKGGRLFAIVLLTLLVPTGAVVVLSLTVLKPLAEGPYFQPLLQVVSMVLLVPYMYMVYRWLVDFRYGSFFVRWDTRFMEAAPTVLGQVLLTIVTAGVYYPAAYLKLYRYFMVRTVVVSGSDGNDRPGMFGGEPKGKPEGRFGFEGEIGKGFLLLWGQALLTLATLGVYTPWAICKVSAWVCEKSWYRWL
jgi:hypothetical protein